MPVGCDGSWNSGGRWSRTPACLALLDAKMEHGTIFAAVNGQDSLVSISPAGRLLSAIFRARRFPTDLRGVAFGTQPRTHQTLHVISGALWASASARYTPVRR